MTFLYLLGRFFGEVVLDYRQRCVVLPALLCWFLGSNLAAQQKLDWVQVGPDVPKALEATWETPAKTVFEGRIKQLDGEQLVIALADGQVRTLDSRRVETVRPEWANDQVAAAQVLLREGKYQEGILAIDEARKAGVPRWQQRFLIAEMVWAAAASGNNRTAGILFVNMADSNAPAMLYADMPLVWASKQLPRALREQAEKWLSSVKDTERLLGASWMLFSDQGEKAKEVLTELQSSSNKTVAQLAAAQAWRTVPPPQTLDELRNWYEFRETLLPPLRLGLTEFIADRLASIGETDLAIGQLVRIANEHSYRYHRAAGALQSAQQLLKRAGRSEEAERLNPWIEKLKKPEA
ncbi:MAG: hypothetical protein AAF483_17965 [Planctomycetota bacterium]